MNTVEITHFHLFCGLGGGAAGFNTAQARVGHLAARFRCLGGVDVDPAAIRDFGRLAGVPGTVLDLFDREQYEAFHGRSPGPGWREATPDDLRRAAGGERPDILFTSPPCKGLSGLLNSRAAGSEKYQALNRLVVRGLMLALEAWSDPPDFILLENVPRIAQRGRPLLDQVQGLLRAHGYVFKETTHDCGELGGLAQHRRRFLLVARRPDKVPSFLYEPPKRRVRAIGEVLGQLPMPDDPRGGPMHRLPRLKWETWVRLALIPAGGDWRDLPGMAPKDETARKAWEQRGERTAGETHWFKGKWGMGGWSAPARTVTGGPNGDYVADPRPTWGEYSQYGVRPMGRPSGAVTAQAAPGTGPFSVADHRWGGGRMGVLSWAAGAGTVTGEAYPSTGPFAAADPRWHADVLGVRSWSAPSGTVTGRAGATTGVFSAADPRATPRFNNVHKVIDWQEPAACITSATGNASGAVADPRAGYHNLCRVLRWGDASTTVTGASRPAGGAQSVADLRLGEHTNKMRVEHWRVPAHTVTGSDRVGSGAPSAADPRPWAGAGHYGVLSWDRTSGAVTGAMGHDAGRGNVADPRSARYPHLFRVFRWTVLAGMPWEPPGPGAPVREVYQIVPWEWWVRPAPAGGWTPPEDVPVIIALDGTWHRPLTTFELGALQDLDVLGEDGPLVLDGASHSAWRERIGNAVPKGTAAAIAGQMGAAILRARLGQDFALSGTPIWVDRAIALGVEQ